MNRVRGAAIGLCLLLAACQGKSDQGAASEADAAKSPAAAAAAATPAADPAAKPEGAEAVDPALAAVQEWNAAAPAVLKSIGDAESKVRSAATRAMEAARGAEAATPARRTALSAQVAAARKEAEAARATVIDGGAKLRRDIDERVTQAESALELCNSHEVLMVYEGCKTLATEHALLLQNIETLSARYQQAEAGFGADRAKLEEASAAVALAALR